MPANNTIPVKVEKLIFGGQALARDNGKTIFLWNALPGETVEYEVLKKRKGIVEALATKILEPSPEKVRFVLQDKSFVDIRISQRIRNRFDFHWERRHVDGTIYRYDNFPDTKFKKLSTYPYHFHEKKEAMAKSSPFRMKLPDAFIDFMEFVRKNAKESS